MGFHLSFTPESSESTSDAGRNHSCRRGLCRVTMSPLGNPCIDKTIPFSVIIGQFYVLTMREYYAIILRCSPITPSDTAVGQDVRIGRATGNSSEGTASRATPCAVEAPACELAR